MMNINEINANPDACAEGSAQPYDNENQGTLGGCSVSA